MRVALLLFFLFHFPIICNISSKGGMNMKEILLYFSIKYEGDWEKIYKAIADKEKVDDSDVKATLETVKCKYITIVDDNYPDKLKNCIRPPFVIYYYGNWDLVNEEKILAVVGTREASLYGIQACEKLVKGTKDGKVIISGMAKGIDTCAHISALESDKKTIAVLGCGIDYIYPKENKELYEKIKNNHLIISEYPFASEPKPDNFKWRNRLVAAVSKAVLVVEAKRKSGTMNTVMWALKMGKEVLAVPSSIFTDSGTNYLIDQGATLVQNGQDIDKEL